MAVFINNASKQSRQFNIYLVTILLTSRRNKEHKVYPYLLRNLTVDRPNQVWAIDITYIPMRKGFMYLVALIDLHSRYVLNWSVSNSMDAHWCKETVEEAIALHGKPEILNTDQGSQFTSEIFTHSVLTENIKLSMDGKGTIRMAWRSIISKLWQLALYMITRPNPIRASMPSRSEEKI